MGGWIRLDKDLEDDPRVDGLAALYGEMMGIPKVVASNAVIGGLYRLWRYGDTHLGRHNRLKPLNGASRGLARISEVTALPTSLLERFPVEWLKVHEDGTIELPDYAAKNAVIDRDVRREKGRDRTRRWRERLQGKNQNGDASHSVTAKTSQRHKNVSSETETGTSETGTGLVAAGPSSVATDSAAPWRAEPEMGPPVPLTDPESRRQVTLLRILHWDDDRILEKWARRGMTEAHLKSAS